MQSPEQLYLNADEMELLEAPPASHRLTLDGYCALAHERGEVVLLDLEGGGLRTVDPAELAPIGWVS